MWLNRAFLILILYAGISIISCRKPTSFKESGSLSFSADSLHFDTIFTTLPSPTLRLSVRNTSGSPLRIKYINLQGGENSPFKLIINGDATPAVAGLELDKGDSALIFVSLTAQGNDARILDRINFETSDQQYEVILDAFVRDAYFLTDTFIACDTVFTPAKAIVVDGPLFVPEGCTLRIEPGTHLYFTPRVDKNYNPASYLFVGGTLQVEGSVTLPVIFEGNRLDEAYAGKGGQWRGIIFGVTSKGSVIDKARIKNAWVGIQIDSLPVDAAPKLVLSRTEISNHSNYGILLQGYSSVTQQQIMLKAENILIDNCAKSCFVMAGGGNADITHATITAFNYDFNRKDPLILLNNYSTTTAYPLFAKFTNCIVEGTEDNEVQLDNANLGGYQVEFNYSLIRSVITMPGIQNMYNQSPAFIDSRKKDYHLNNNSPAINKGIATQIFTDLDGKSRPQGAGPDLGCFEYQP